MTLPAILIALCPLWFTATGETRPLDACVPAEAMAVYFGRPSPEMLNAPAGGLAGQLAGWLITLKAAGVIPREGRVIADAVATLPMLARRPHALVLLDITSQQVRPEVYTLKEMQAALLIDGEGLSVEIDRRIRDLLATYTDADNARIDVSQAGEVSYHRLTDRRLPGWSVVAWGQIKEQFLLAFGQGAFEKTLLAMQGRARSLTDDPWFTRAHARCRGANSGIEVFVNLARIRDRVGEVVKDRPGEVLGALGMSQAERLVWTVGFDGRALRSEIVTRQVGGDDQYALLTGKEIAAPEVLAAIPPEAGAYAVFRCPLSEVARNGWSAWLQSHSDETARTLTAEWAQLEKEHQFNAEKDVADRLGDHLIFHTYPRHPLGLPLLCTIWIQFNGQRPTVARTIDRMMALWQNCLDRPAQTRPAIGLRPRLHRDPDGIWYMQLGLLAPALGVANGWIVISFSPDAVRANLSYLSTTRPE